MAFVKKNLFSLIAALLVVVAIVLFAAPAVSYEATILGTKTADSWSGFETLFGSTRPIAGGLKLEIKAIPTVTISFFVLILGLVCTCFNTLVETKFKKIIAIVAMALLAAGAIVLFFNLAAFIGVNEINENVTKYYSLGAGSIISAILALVAAALEALTFFGVIKSK